MIEVIIGAVLDGKRLSGAEHGNIEKTETGPGDQYSVDDQVIDCLTSLKFHHASGNQVFVRCFFMGTPAVYDGVKHYQIKPRRDWQVKQLEQRTWIAHEQILVDCSGIVAHNCTGKNQKEAVTIERRMTMMANNTARIRYVEMKGINGMETARQIRTFNKNLLIVFVTGYADYVFDGYQVGALDYLMKPV